MAASRVAIDYAALRLARPCDLKYHLAMRDAGRTSPRLLSRTLMCVTGLLVLLWLGSVKVEFTPYDNGWDHVRMSDGALVVASVDPQLQRDLGPQPRGPVFEWQSTWHMQWWWDRSDPRNTDPDLAALSLWILPLWPAVVLTGAAAVIARSRESKGNEA